MPIPPLPTDLRTVEVLKESSASLVVLAEKPSGQVVVARLLRPHAPPPASMLQSLLSKLQSVRHPALQAVSNVEELWLLSPYVTGPTAASMVAADADLLLITAATLDMLSACTLLHGLGLRMGLMDPTDVVMSAGQATLVDCGLYEMLFPHEAPRVSPWHVPPEVRRGQAGDERSDIFGVGAVAWWLLTGESPKVESLDAAESLWTALQRTRPDMPRAWADAFLHMLELYPSTRPQAASEAAQALLPWLTSAPDERTWVGGAPVLAPSRPVTSIGPYRVRQLLGEGGMAQVFAAEGGRFPHPVALKLLLPDAHQDAELRLRFEREIAICMTLRHPNVCAMLDWGQTDEGCLYLVMELLEGEVLADYAERLTPSPWGLVRPILGQLLEGVMAMHGAGIIHRDLKPGNIFLTRNGTVKIMDFGIARQEGGKPLTETGELLGSPGYLSLEQLSDSKRVDARTDLYNVGLLAYLLLTRHLPFEATRAEDVLTKIMMEPPTPLTQHRADLPPDVVQWVGRLIEKQAADRYQTAAEAHQAFLAL